MTHAVRVRRLHNSKARLLFLVRLLKAPAFALARAKHFVCAIYFLAMTALYGFAAPQDYRAVTAFAPKAVCAGMAIFALLHVYGLLQTCHWCQRKIHAPPRAVVWLSRLPQSTILSIFHFVEVVSQSYQAYRMSFYLVNSTEAFVYAFLVSLYCLVTPWFLFARDEFVRQSLVIIIDSYLGFFTSTAFPAIVFISQAIRLVLLDRRLQGNDKFATVSILLGRYIVVTSPLDLITKFVIQLSSYLSLRRLVLSMHKSHHSRGSVSRDASMNEHTEGIIAESFQLQFHSRRYLIVYLVANLLWGVAMLASTIHANWFRTDCPDYCSFSTSPWFNSACSCVYLELNCATRGIKGDNIDAYLHPEIIGTSLFFLDVRRCALPSGITMDALAPFQDIYGIFIYYSNMTSWPQHPTKSFPSSLIALHIRGSQLSEMPQALLSIPSDLVFLRLHGNDISYIPDEYFHAWRGIYSLALASMKLTTISSKLLNMQNLAVLEIRGHSIRSLPSDWEARVSSNLLNLKSLDLSANQLHTAPWSLVSTKLTLDMSSNPIFEVPASVNPSVIASRMLILDDTPYCTNLKGSSSSSCEAKCDPLCPSKLLSNYRCEIECYSDKCSFDAGDCADWGF